jgi:excisionase family DNA binding protein
MSQFETEQTPMSQGARWLSVEEIAQHLGISKETVYRWLEKGKIPAHRMGKLWKFQISEVDAWVMRGGASEDTASSAKFRESRKS